MGRDRVGGRTPAAGGPKGAPPGGLEGLEPLDDVVGQVRPILRRLLEQLEEQLLDPARQPAAHLVGQRRRRRPCTAGSRSSRGEADWNGGSPAEHLVEDRARGSRDRCADRWCARRSARGSCTAACRCSACWSGACASSTLAMPKSITLSAPPLALGRCTMTFSGLRSRWTIGGSCPCADRERLGDARRRCSTASGHGSAPRARGAPARSVRPSRNSSTITSSPSTSMRREAPDDVRVLEVREDLHLVQEEPPPVLAPGELRAEHLERDAPLREPLLGLVDLAHPAFADEAADEVFAKLIHERDLPSRPDVGSPFPSRGRELHPSWTGLVRPGPAMDLRRVAGERAGGEVGWVQGGGYLACCDDGWICDDVSGPSWRTHVFVQARGAGRDGAHSTGNRTTGDRSPVCKQAVETSNRHSLQHARRCR